MARRVKLVPISAEGRDKGKIFVITEMPASQAEEWAMRALLAVSRSGFQLPDDLKEAGLAGVAVAGLKATFNLDYAELKPLMEEMFTCVAIQPDPNNAFIRKLIESDIEEVATRVHLRAEVFQLHTGFSIADGQSNTNLKTPSVQAPKVDSSHRRTSPVQSRR